MPEWDHIAAKEHGGQGKANLKPRSSAKDTFQRKLDAAMPPHRKYIGLRRNIFLAVLLAVLLALLALIIGLAVGLSKKSKYGEAYSSSKSRTNNHLSAAKIFLYLPIQIHLKASSRTFKPDWGLAARRMASKI